MATLFTVIANPYTANASSGCTPGCSPVGALIVGWSIGREGHARLALTLIAGRRASSLAVSVIVQGVTQYAAGDFSGVYPAAGPSPCTRTSPAACSASPPPSRTSARPGCGGRRWFAQACFWICVVGIAFTQSRQAMVGLAVALIVIVMRTQNSGESAARR